MKLLINIIAIAMGTGGIIATAVSVTHDIQWLTAAGIVVLILGFVIAVLVPLPENEEERQRRLLIEAWKADGYPDIGD